MERKFIVVWYQSDSILIRKTVADMLSIQNKHIVQTEKEFWNILEQNASFSIAICKQMLTPSN